jgi:energy-coupling factor transport system ATP-binding protein
MLLNLKDVCYKYSYGTYKVSALENINFKIHKGDFIGVMGKTGSGKSTLLQILNGILYPTAGDIYYNNEKISKKNKNIKKLRDNVGLLFQFPEHQLFAETLHKDIEFGLLNKGYSKIKIKNEVKEAMNLVGLSYNRYKDISPFSLSGGEQRKAAFAGVLVLKPEILVLDEPTVGLDTKEKNNFINILQKVHKENNTTIIAATHSIENIIDLASRLLIMKEGKIILDDEPDIIVKKSDLLEEAGIELPAGQRVLKMLREKGVNIRDDLYKPGDVEEEIYKWARGQGLCLKD